jgi:hypothetical protein
MSDNVPNRDDLSNDEIRQQDSEYINSLINTINSSSLDEVEVEVEVDVDIEIDGLRDEPDVSFEDVLIPCEICNQQISFQNYQIHSQICFERNELANRVRMDIINRTREQEITHNYNINFRPISFNLESDYNTRNYDINGVELPRQSIDIHNDDTDISVSSGISEDLPDLIEDDNLEISPLIDDEIYNFSNVTNLFNENGINGINYSDIVNAVRHNINNSHPIYLNVTEFFNELTRISLDLDKVISDLENDDFKDDEYGNSVECPICYEKLKNFKYDDEINTEDNMFQQEQQNKGVKILCGHKFCNNCIRTWLKKDVECPLCKSDMKQLLHDTNAEINAEIAD